MKKEIVIVVLAILAGLTACDKIFEEHYNAAPDTIDKRLWEVVSSNPDFSEFVNLFTAHELDSLFSQEGSYTLFIPNNEAFASFDPEWGDNEMLLRFHLLDYLFNVVSVEKSRSIQTSARKFSLVEFLDGTYQYDGSQIVESSPLYLDGRYYVLDEIAYPKQNLYEFITQNAPTLKQYVDAFDSILMDLDQSTPIGFDDEGNTIYDSVYVTVNYFDTLYFPLKEEHRSRNATFVLFDDQQYSEGLDAMALDLGGLSSGDEIPEVWQQEVLMPELISLGLFPNALQYDEFLAGQMRNIEGDTVEVDYTAIDPESRQLCSNGVVYKYSQFQVPPYLYKGEVYVEGEHMVDSVAAEVFFWKPEYKVSGSIDAVAASPFRIISPGARNDSIVTATFPGISYDGEFTFEFTFSNMFPQKYLFVWGANFRPSGMYEVYVNDVMITQVDLFNLRSAYPSVVPGHFHMPVNGNNMVDAWVDHLTEFGDVKITLKYISSGRYSTNGINIDFISLIPEDAIDFENLRR